MRPHPTKPAAAISRLGARAAHLLSRRAAHMPDELRDLQSEYVKVSRTTDALSDQLATLQAEARGWSRSLHGLQHSSTLLAMVDEVSIYY